MRRSLSLVLLWLLATVLIAEARFVKTWWNPGSTAVLPFQGLGDILTNVVTYHSASSCWQNNQTASTVALIKDFSTGATSTTLGCSGPIGPGTGVPVVTTGSPLVTTCASTCVVDTIYDPSPGNNCSAAPCNIQQTDNTLGRANPRAMNPTYVANCAPNGTSYCMHFQGWANGGSGVGGIASGTYNNATGVAVITTTPTNYYLAGGSIHLAALTFSPSGPAGLNGDWQVTSATANTITIAAGTGLGTCTASCITGGNYTPNAQQLNNYTGTFAQINQPFTVFALMTCDGYQNAGTGGGPNSNKSQNDAIVKVGCQTTPATGGPTGPATLIMTDSTTTITACSTSCTMTQSITYGSWYSLLGVFNGGSSWFCINGTCTAVSLTTTVNWATGSAGNTGYSYGNGSGGAGFKFLEGGMSTIDQHAQAVAVYANQKARFGNF